MLCGHPNIIACYVNEYSLTTTMFWLLTAFIYGCLFNVSNFVIKDILNQKTTYDADEDAAN